VRTDPSLLTRAERALWTGPAGHLLGGTLDLLGALARHLLTRIHIRIGSIRIGIRMRARRARGRTAR
jgi:hypothetical protein